MTMKLSKTIPSRVKTVEFNWITEFQHKTGVTQQYLDIRNGISGKRKGTMTSCDWCKKNFNVGDRFYLASAKPNQEGPKRNWALCQNCVEEANRPF